MLKIRPRTKYEVVMSGAMGIRAEYGKREALRVAWAVYKALTNALKNSFDTTMVVDMQCCPECLSGAWLITDGSKVICLKCGVEWLIIEVLDGAVAYRLDKSREFWEAHIDQVNDDLEVSQ